MKIFKVIFILSLILFPIFGLKAQENTSSTAEIASPTTTEAQIEALSKETLNEIFEARVLEILDQREIPREDGSFGIQQNLKLKGLEGTWKGKEFEFDGISEIDAVSANVYKKGDRVIVNYQTDLDGNDVFYVVDFVRRWPLYLLAILFALAITIIGKVKGLRSLLALVLSFLIILKLTVPLILAGWPPLTVGVVTCVIIFLAIIYLTDGWNQKSHLAVISLILSLIVVALLSALFTHLTRITGTASEETLFLIGIGAKAIDFKGLFLAGLLIGALGVLDDVVIAQIEAVVQIKKLNPKLPWTKTFTSALEVGNAHLGAMVNTLFLAYAGASLPLLMLFSIKQAPFLTFNQVINGELIASEIVRTLVGSLGLAVAIPISTYLAAKYFIVRESKPDHDPVQQ